MRFLDFSEYVINPIDGSRIGGKNDSRSPFPPKVVATPAAHLSLQAETIGSNFKDACAVRHDIPIFDKNEGVFH